MERRIQQANGNRKPLHDAEQVNKVLTLIGQKFCQCGTTALLCFGQDHLAHRDNTFRIKEHVFGPAKANAFCPETTRSFGLFRGLGVGADFKATQGVCPFHKLREITRKIGLKGRDFAQHDFAGCAIKGDYVPFLKGHTARHHGFVGVVDLDRTRTANARCTHATCNHGCVAGHAAARCQNALRGMHARDIFRACFDAHQNDLAPLACPFFGNLGRKDDLARSRAGRCGKAHANDLAGRIGIKSRVQ